MYRLPFELTGSAKLLHFTILGGSADPPPCPLLNDATGCYGLEDTLSASVSAFVWPDGV